MARKVLPLDTPFQGLAPALALDYAGSSASCADAALITESSGALLDRIAAATVQIERGEILSPQT